MTATSSTIGIAGQHGEELGAARRALVGPDGRGLPMRQYLGLGKGAGGEGGPTHGNQQQRQDPDHDACPAALTPGLGARGASFFRQ
jgi:hypothetical protein